MFDSNVVPDVSLRLNDQESSDPRRQVALPYVLSVATQACNLYEVHLSNYLLQKNESIYVEGPFPLTSNDSKYLRCFQAMKDQGTDEVKHCLGYMVGQGSSQSIFEVQNLGQERRQNFTQTRITIRDGLGIMNQVAEKLTSTLINPNQGRTSQLDQIMGGSTTVDSTQHADTKLIATKNKQREQTQIRRSYQILGNETGIVGMRAIHELNLIASLNSNGVLKISNVN